MHPSPEMLDDMTTIEASAAILRRFGWARKHETQILALLDWQASLVPRPNNYYRWHLPRLLVTLSHIQTALTGITHPQILDLACYPPFSLLLEQQHPGDWLRTSFEGGYETVTVNGVTKDLPLLPIDLSARQFELPIDSFDLVLLMETIEHIDRHPQRVLEIINRSIRIGGYLLVTTPNVTSWKKIKNHSDGNWSYDSSTFGEYSVYGGWYGHRYEYSPYQFRSVLTKCGFEQVRETYQDVYLDDPHSFSHRLQLWLFLVTKALTLQPRRAAKLWMRRGSGMFLLWKKTRNVEPAPLNDLISI